MLPAAVPVLVGPAAQERQGDVADDPESLVRARCL